MAVARCVVAIGGEEKQIQLVSFIWNLRILTNELALKKLKYYVMCQYIYEMIQILNIGQRFASDSLRGKESEKWMHKWQWNLLFQQ